MEDPHLTALREFLSELDSGEFQRKVASALFEVARGLTKTDKPGKFALEFSIKPAKNSNQSGAGIKVMVSHRLVYQKPTYNGKLSEENTTETPMWINKDGSVTVLAKSHDDMFPDTTTDKSPVASLAHAR